MAASHTGTKSGTYDPKSSPRYAKWVAAGKPKMADWVKSGAGTGAKSGLLDKRVAAEKTQTGKQLLLDRYAKWVDTGRPKMDAWVKAGAGYPGGKIPTKNVKPGPLKPTKGAGQRAAGKFTTLRGNGPRQALSMTPERLQAAARQRIVNYH